MQAKHEWAFQNVVNHPKARKLLYVCVHKLQIIATKDYMHGLFLLMNFVKPILLNFYYDSRSAWKCWENKIHLYDNKRRTSSGIQSYIANSNLVF